MHRRLPRWVWVGGATLAAVAGMVNAAGLLGIQHHGVSHMTGNAAAVGTNFASAAWRDAGHFAAILASFVLGAAISGIIIHDATLRLGPRYGVALLTESAMLAVSIPLLTRGHIAGDYLVSAAMGLQNAMATTFSSAIVRTTHVTGLLTDIGILLGHRLHGERLDGSKLFLLAALAGGFMLGSLVGAFLFLWLGYAAIWLPVVITSSGSATYLWLRKRNLVAVEK